MILTARRSVRALAALGAAAALAGCSFVNPILTQEPYATSEGVQVWLTPQLRAENVMVLAAEEGATGRVLGVLVNDTQEPATLTLSVADGGLSSDLDAGGFVVLGEDDEVVMVPEVPVAPGRFIDVELSVPGQGSVTAAAPVLDGTLPQYSELVP